MRGIHTNGTGGRISYDINESNCLYLDFSHEVITKDSLMSINSAFLLKMNKQLQIVFFAIGGGGITPIYLPLMPLLVAILSIMH